jgi:hypothetical protein
MKVEKTIPHEKPMSQLAEYLRYLRSTVGNPSYRELGTLVYLTHNALSQSVDGRFVRWERVEMFLRAINCYCPGYLTDYHIRLAEILHHQGTEEHRGTAQAAAEAMSMIWEELDRRLRTPGELAAQTRAPGSWATTNIDRIRRLNGVKSRWELLVILQEMFDLVEDLRSTTDADWTIDTVERALMIRYLTPERLHRMVRATGGSDGDFLAWAAAWERTAEMFPTIPQQRDSADGCFPAWGSGAS